MVGAAVGGPSRKTRVPPARYVEVSECEVPVHDDGFRQWERGAGHRQKIQVERNREHGGSAHEDEAPGSVSREARALENDFPLSGGLVQNRDARGRRVGVVSSLAESEQNSPASGKDLREEVRVLSRRGVQLRQLRQRASRGGHDIEGSVELPRQYDLSVLTPAGAGRDRRHVRQRNGGPSRERHLLELCAREEADPLPVRGEERGVTSLGSADQLRRAAAQGPPEQRRGALVDAGEDDGFAVRRNGDGATIKREAFCRRNRQNRTDDRRAWPRRRRSEEKQGGRDRGREHGAADSPREAPAPGPHRGSRNLQPRGRGGKCFLELDPRVGDVVEAALRVLLQAAAKEVPDAGRCGFRQRAPVGLRPQDRRKRV